MDESGTKPGRRSAGWLGYLSLGLLAGLAFAGSRLLSTGEPDWPAEELVDPPAVAATPARPAGSTRLRPDARVIGVSIGGRHRAYVVSWLTPIKRHVLNDRIGEVPVTVAYCDRTDCATAYTADPGVAPEVSVGGWADGGMLVKVGRHRYRQLARTSLADDAPPFPLSPVAVEQTTWGEWRAAHPDTEVSGADSAVSQ